MDTYQIMIGAYVVFRQILSKILRDGPSLSLYKSDRPFMIKSRGNYLLPHELQYLNTFLS
jgi:hypothetical protein